MSTTSDLLDQLEAHYLKPGDQPGGMFVREVGVNGSFGASSRCDAIYVGFTSTSGRSMVGHEVKASRADWLHELAREGKADLWHDACHQWYVVAPSTSIVKPDELPMTWGLMVPKKRVRRFQIVKRAAVIHDQFEPPWWAVRSVMARWDTIAANRIRQEVATQVRAHTEVYERRREESAAALTMSPQQREKLEAAERLEELLGVTISGYDWEGQVGTATLLKAVALVRGLNDHRLRALDPAYAHQTLRAAGRALEDAVAAFDELRKQVASDATGPATA